MQHHASDVVVATFTAREAADAATRDLHHAGVRRTWLAVTQTVDENTFGGAGGTVGAGRERVVPLEPAAATWFRHEDPRNAETLYDALREHGVAEEDARRIDGTVIEGNCVLVIEDARDSRAATQIVQRHGGDALIADAATNATFASDPIGDAARAQAAERHPAQHVPTFKEELFVRRHAPPSSEPAPY